MDLQGEPTTFWGKLRREPSGACEWHPLIHHCADVAAVAEALTALPVWRDRLARLAGRELNAGDWSRLSVFAALHDVGKLNLGFQAKGRPELGATAGHVSEALAALSRSDVLSSLFELSDWGQGTTGLLVSAIAHHGRPHSIASVGAKWQKAWWEARAGLDPRAGCRGLLDLCKQWFPLAFESGTPLPETTSFAHAFAGLVTLADWIGSDRRFFPFSPGLDDRMPAARAAARHALAMIGLDIPGAARRDPRNRNAFSRIASPGYVVRPAQAAIVDLPLHDTGAITILEAETGSGKTEAALARFVQLFEAGLVDGLYFALPTRTAATQIHERVVAAAARAFVQPPAVVLAVPGYLRVDDAEGTRLPGFEVLWPDRECFRSRAWAAENAKRYLAGCIVVGTIDQVLLSALMVGHAHLRASALLRHLLVVDEVHASDAYMEQILQTVLEHHVTAGGHALLLSATLGAEARTRLLQPGEKVTPPSLQDALAAPYPLITHRAGEVKSHVVHSDQPRRDIEMRMEPWVDRPDEIASAAMASAVRGAKVLVIRNTVADCTATQQAIERAAMAGGNVACLFACAGVPAPHHARFARNDRRALDAALETRLGKERPDAGCVVIATQTVQQSLDLDADLLFSDLCPSDVLLQRLGRLHRHVRTRPHGFEAAVAKILVPLQRDLGLAIGNSGVARGLHSIGTVYPDLRIIEATWRLLEEMPRWRIPAMNRELVERSLHSQALETIVREGGDRWRAHANYVIGTERGHARHAELYVVDWSRAYEDSNFPDAADERIATRLGEGDRLVRFDPQVPGPFGNPVAELVIPARWVRKVPPDIEQAAGVQVRDGDVSFALGDEAFVYDRLGLRRSQG